MKPRLCGLKEEYRVFAQSEQSVGREKRLQVAVGLRWLARRNDSASQGGVPEGADGLANIFLNYDLDQEVRLKCDSMSLLVSNTFTVRRICVPEFAYAAHRLLHAHATQF